ncbi:MAG: two-component regulator propeller domain-containing protein, partial [Chitinophagaceae bacterium]
LHNKYILTSSSRFQNHLIQLLPNKIILTANFLNNQYSKAAVPLSDSNNLIITSNGAYVFNAKNGSTSPHQFSYNGHQMKGLNGCTYAEADEGYNIYFNSYSGLYFSQKQVTTQWLRQYAITNNFENDFRGFATNNNGKIWLATTQGVYEANINTISGEFETFPGKKLPIDYPSFRYLIYHKNQLFIGSSGNGVFVWNTLSKKIKKAYLADSYSIKEKIAFDSAYIWKMAYYDSAHLLIAAGNGLYLLHMQQLVAKKINAQLASGNSRSLFINNDSVIWHGSVSGLTLLSKEFKTICTIANPFPDKRIGDIASISKHKALIGTTGLYEVAYNFGKNTYSAKRLTIFPNNVFVYTITKDAENKFWLGTNNGIYCYDYFLQKIWHFSSNDNIQQAPFNSNGSLTLQNNILLFGGRDGVQIIHPTALLNHASTEKPVKPFIETLKAGKIQHTIAPNCSIQLPYTQRQIEFSIQCNELFQPDIVKYRYVINGKTSEIVPSHNNILVSNLSYGTNILNTEASVN